MLTMRKGDTFGFGSPIAIRVDGVALQDLSDWSATFVVTTATGKPVASGDCVIASGHLATETLATDLWPTETLVLDLKVTNGVFVKHLPSVQIKFE